MEKRIFLAVRKVQTILPAWALPLLAVGFILLGQTVFVGVLLGLSILLKFPIIVDGGAYLFCFLLGFGFIALILCAWVKWLEKRPLSDLGFFRHVAWRELVLGSSVGLGIYSLAIGIQYLLGAVRLESVDVSLGTLGYVLAIIPFWLLQGGTEELVMRGWLLPTVTYRSNLLLGLMISSSLFAVMHLANPGITILSVLNLLLFGLFAGLYLIDRDSLWGVIGIHGIWNFAQGSLFGVEVSGNTVPNSILTMKPTQLSDWLTGGSFGTEGSLITSLVLLVGIYVLYRRIDFEKLILKNSGCC